ARAEQHGGQVGVATGVGQRAGVDRRGRGLRRLRRPLDGRGVDLDRQLEQVAEVQRAGDLVHETGDGLEDLVDVDQVGDGLQDLLQVGDVGDARQDVVAEDATERALDDVAGAARRSVHRVDRVDDTVGREASGAGGAEQAPTGGAENAAEQAGG